MVYCSYCGDMLGKRLVFCKPSHKVMYHYRLKVNNPKGSSSAVADNMPVVKVPAVNVSKNNFCPHFILEGLNCGSCNG